MKKRYDFKYVEAGNYKIRRKMQVKGGVKVVTIEAFHIDSSNLWPDTEIPARVVYCIDEDEADVAINQMRHDLAIKQLNEVMGHG